MTVAVENGLVRGVPASPAVPRDAAGVERLTVRFLGKQGPFRPSVRLLEQGGVKMVAKDYRACTPLYRWTVGAWNLAREEAALRRLDGVEGVPRLLGRVDRWLLLISWMRGRDLGKVRRFRQSPEFFDKLMRVVEEMHARGVVHLDLRQRRNILLCLQPDKIPRPAVLDFGSALCVRPGGLLHRWLARIDRSGVLKYKRRAQPDAITRDEARSLRRIERRRKLWPF
jgi:RIO-like serine/threonine protein kinase